MVRGLVRNCQPLSQLQSIRKSPSWGPLDLYEQGPRGFSFLEPRHLEPRLAGFEWPTRRIRKSVLPRFTGRSQIPSGVGSVLATRRGWGVATERKSVGSGCLRISGEVGVDEGTCPQASDVGVHRRYRSHTRQPADDVRRARAVSPLGRKLKARSTS